MPPVRILSQLLQLLPEEGSLVVEVKMMATSRNLDKGAERCVQKSRVLLHEHVQQDSVLLNKRE